MKRFAYETKEQFKVRVEKINKRIRENNITRALQYKSDKNWIFDGEVKGH